MVERTGTACLCYYISRWLLIFSMKNLSLENYQEFLDFEMPAEELDYHPVFTIRSSSARPDDQPKNARWEWEKLPALGEMNPD